MLRFLWGLTILCAGCAGLLLVDIWMNPASNGPQQAAKAAIACALCIVPYVLARAVEGLRALPRDPDRVSPRAIPPEPDAWKDRV